MSASDNNRPLLLNTCHNKDKETRVSSAGFAFPFAVLRKEANFIDAAY